MGNMKPKIRFKEFEGEWESKSLAQIATLSKGKGYSKSDLRPYGTPIILYGRMYTDYQFCINKVDTFAALRPNSILSKE